MNPVLRPRAFELAKEAGASFSRLVIPTFAESPTPATVKTRDFQRNLTLKFWYLPLIS